MRAPAGLGRCHGSTGRQDRRQRESGSARDKHQLSLGGPGHLEAGVRTRRGRVRQPDGASSSGWAGRRGQLADPWTATRAQQDVSTETTASTVGTRLLVSGEEWEDGKNGKTGRQVDRKTRRWRRADKRNGASCRRVRRAPSCHTGPPRPPPRRRHHHRPGQPILIMDYVACTSILYLAGASGLPSNNTNGHKRARISRMHARAYVSPRQNRQGALER